MKNINKKLCVIVLLILLLGTVTNVSAMYLLVPDGTETGTGNCEDAANTDCNEVYPLLWTIPYLDITVLEFMVQNTYIPFVGETVFDGLSKPARMALAKQIADNMDVEAKQAIDYVVTQIDWTKLTKEEAIEMLKRFR